MSEPTTEAGRRLLDGFAPMPPPDAPELHRRSAMGRRNKLIGGIVDIEDEARADVDEECLAYAVTECHRTYAEPHYAQRLAAAYRARVHQELEGKIK